MQQIKWGIIVFVVGLFLLVSRASAFTCTGWGCDYVPCEGGTCQTCHGTPAGCDEYGYAPWVCIDNPGLPGCPGGVSCGPGKYACNRAADDYCCPIGSGSGGSTAPREQRSYSCDAYSWPDWNQIIDTQCISWGTSVSGNAIRQMPNGGGYCLNAVCIPNEWETCPLTPYQYAACCANGTVSTPTDTVGDDYTYTHSCHDNGGYGQVCQNPTDIWKSDALSTEVCYVAEHNCSYDKDDNPYDCEYFNVYKFSTTCTRVTRTYSCEPTCNTTAPSGVTVANVPTVGTSVTINWQIGANGWGQLFWVDESSNSEVETGCPTLGDCEASIFLDAGITSQVVYGLQPLTQYNYRIVTYRDQACHTSVNGTFTTPASSGAISGIVYLDASNTCDETSTLNNVNVVLDGVTTDNTDPAGAFSFTGLALNSSHSLAVSLTNGYICSTSPACSAYPCTVGGVVSPDSSRKFYLTQNQGSWWQAEGATIYTGGSTGVTIGSTIPASIPDLDRYLIVGGALGSLSSGSILRSSATAASLGAGGASVVGYQARTIYRGDRANYSYFKNEMGLSSTADSLLNLDSKPDDGAAFHYIDHATTLGDSLGTAWTVDADEKYVIFVNGDLDINVDITVAPGGFAAFIVNGSINVSPDVENIQGMFVANQNFNTVSNGTVDTQLTVEGSVVAWGDVSLDRDLVTNNSNSPAEKFVYRPDLLISMPDEMKSFVMQWSEVVPGTYDE